MIENFIIRFYESANVLKYPWVYYDRYEDFLPKENIRDELGHQRTGSMDCGGFDRLMADIKEHGIENPFIIEYYNKDLPNAQGLREAPVLAIRTGNNRAEAMHQLKITNAPALFVVPRTQVGNLPTTGYVDIPINRYLEGRVCDLWHEVVRGNDEPLGIVSAWRDSELLTDIIRGTKNA